MVVYNYKDIAMLLLFQKQDANVLDDEPMLGMGMITTNLAKPNNPSCF